MIRAEGVTKVFGPNPESVKPLLEQGKSKDEIQAETGHVVGVNNASFEVGAGEVFCIMGLSGSGKSTLIRCINRLIEPTFGKIILDDPEHGELDIATMDGPTLRRVRSQHLSMVFQHFALFPHKTVLSNVVYGLEVQGRDKAEREELGKKYLEMVGLGGWENHYPDELSGGMQQRVGLARAVATEANILLMDEPFSALDPLIKVQMQDELMRIQQELGRTILFITHDLDEAMRIGDHIAIMDAGKIVQVGNPEEILVNPKTEYVAKFVEHADPTGVITAETVALPFTDRYFNQIREEGGNQVWTRTGYTDVEFHVDTNGHLAAMRCEGNDVALHELEEKVTETGGAPERHTDAAVHCTTDTILKRVLRGRAYSELPVVVQDTEGRLKGVIDEPELIHGILEKQGYAQDD
ncbi:quaternary amine ABC transporter ATP-binding protein [Vreelandella utahensis]|uniref:quaternary amine ABC transporter ATP-binding protein n=1 Tax=Vreelandella halophila TaxID=86177 RepID=UPI001C4DDB4C|nr:glycine betaine/L-proline ABC transporter ATP-binding protein [Halomonas utahensis]